MECYEAYKDSRVEWIGELPVGWEVKKLKYVASLKTGYTPSKDEKENYSDDGITWVKPNDLKGFNPVCESKEKVSKLGLKVQHIVPKGSLLVCCIGSIGKYGVAGLPLITNQQINALVFNHFVTDVFGRYLIAASVDEHQRNANGNVVKILNIEKQGNIFFPIPPKPKQTAIANFLDRKTAEVDALITQKERLLELYEEEKTAIINHAVTKGIDPNAELKDSGVEWLGEIPDGWEMKKLVRIVEKLTNGYVGPTREIMRDSGVPYIQGIHIKNNSIRFTPSGNYYVEKDWSISHSKSILKTDDLLVVQTGSIGDVGIVHEEFDGANCHALLIVRVNQNHVLPKYLLNYLSSPIGFALLQKIKTGEILFHINGSKLKAIDITLPPLNKQTTIVQHIEAETSRIDVKIAKTQRIIELQKEYRTALISEVVTGKIKVSHLIANGVTK